MTHAISSVLDACAAATLRQRIVTAALATTPVNLTTVSVSSITSRDGVATVTTAAAHGFLPEEFVTIAGATPTTYNGDFRILTVPSSTTFTVQVPKGIVTAATGTLTAKGALWFRQAIFVGLKAARTANTGIVYLGLDSANDTQPIAIAASATLTLNAAVGARLNLGDLWLDVATNADGVVVWFH